MNVYITAVMIVGGRLTPGYLVSHMNVMGQVMEQISLKRDVAQKAAFMVCQVVYVFLLLLCHIFRA